MAKPRDESLYGRGHEDGTKKDVAQDEEEGLVRESLIGQ